MFQEVNGHMRPAPVKDERDLAWGDTYTIIMRYGS